MTGTPGQLAPWSHYLQVVHEICFLIYHLKVVAGSVIHLRTLGITDVLKILSNYEEENQDDKQSLANLEKKSGYLLNPYQI